VGLAVSAVVLWQAATRPGSVATRVGRVIALAPIVAWGLLAYMAYQQTAFGNPFAFARTQLHRTCESLPQAESDTKFTALATLEPALGVYDPGSPRFWAARDDTEADASFPVFNLTFWNPALFMG